MMKKFISVLAVFSLFALAVPVSAVSLPDAASDTAVISLGKALDPQSGKMVEGYAIIHFKNPNGKGGNGNNGQGGGNKGPKAPTCYTHLAKGAKWKTVENWVVNTNNASGLASNSVFNILDNGVSKWEDAADGTVGDGGSVNILGAGSVTAVALVADQSSPDGQNEVYFGDPGSSAIGVTIVWGIFGGPPSGRELVEWDQIYNDVDYPWSDSGAAGAMDFDNIATHELGHSVGLGDLYTASCVNETMYGYADFGETNKQTLETGDIEGIKSLYQ